MEVYKDKVVVITGAGGILAAVLSALAVSFLTKPRAK